MILRMESSLTRTLKTKDHPCCDTTNDDACGLRKTQKPGRKRRRGYLALAVEVSKEAQKAILGTRPGMVHPGSSKTLTIGRFLQQRELHCPDE